MKNNDDTKKVSRVGHKNEISEDEKYWRYKKGFVCLLSPFGWEGYRPKACNSKEQVKATVLEI